MTANATTRKQQLRHRMLRARLDSALSPDSSTQLADRLAGAAVEYFTAHGWPSAIAAYLPLMSEPSPLRLIDAITDHGGRSIVPSLRPDGELDWVTYRPGDPTVQGLRGTIRPNGVPLGIDAVHEVDVVLIPALAVDRTGRRLGRGGGSYDRTLARLRAAHSPALVVAVVHDAEIVDEVPVDEHDEPVDGALSPGGLALFSRAAAS